MALELVPSDELIDELFRRHDHCVFVARKEKTANHYLMIGRQKGDPYTNIGLCHQEIIFLLRDAQNSQWPIGPEEEA